MGEYNMNLAKSKDNRQSTSSMSLYYAMHSNSFLILFLSGEAGVARGSSNKLGVLRKKLYIIDM
jgi:hypothetical protein